MTHVDLIFHGELQPGFDPQAVKDRLAGLLKLKPEQAEALFSGRRVVLRRGLPAEEAERYVAYLTQTVGVQVVAEPREAKTSSAGLPPQPVSAPPPMPAKTPVEEVVCPKCGESQPPRNLCRKCTIDMQRFREAQAAAIAEARAVKMPQATIGNAAGAPSRTGRLGYAVAGLLIVAALGMGMRSAATKTVTPAATAVESANTAEPIEAVEIFTTRTCPNCAAAKAYMRHNDIRFTEYDVEGDAARLKEFYDRGGRGVPLIFVHGKPMHGFDPDQFERLRADAG